MKKKLIIGALAALLMVSCGKGGFRSSYNVLSSFEFSNLETLCGDDSVYFDKSFGDQALFFMNNYEKTGNYGGCAISMLRDCKFEAGHESSDYSCADSSASVTRGKAFMLYTKNTFPSATPSPAIQNIYAGAAGYTLTLDQLYVCNTNKIVNLALYGSSDGTIPAFQEGDYLNVIIKSTDAKGGVIASVKQELINRKGSLSYIHKWTKVDISSLGQVNYMDIDFETNRTDLPLAVCIDNIISNLTIEG